MQANVCQHCNFLSVSYSLQSTAQSQGRQRYNCKGSSFKVTVWKKTLSSASYLESFDQKEKLKLRIDFEANERVLPISWRVTLISSKSNLSRPHNTIVCPLYQ